MRALNPVLTVAGFAAVFAVLFVTSAVVTATVHRALRVRRGLGDPRLELRRVVSCGQRSSVANPASSMRLARVLTRARRRRFSHPLTQLESHIRQLHDALDEANGGVGAALRGCRKHRGAVENPRSCIISWNVPSRLGTKTYPQGYGRAPTPSFNGARHQRERAYPRRETRSRPR